MRKTYLGQCVLCAVLVLVSSSAWAKEGWYAGVKGGVVAGADADTNAGTLDAELGPAVMGAAGYAIGTGARVEGEISWRKNDVDTDGIGLVTIQGVFPFDLSLENLAFMVNGAYDFQLDSPVTPFIMGGIGFSRVSGTLEILGEDFDEDEIAFAYQCGAGLAWHVTESVSVDVSYRFFGTTEPELDPLLEINNTHHNGLVGLTYSF